MEFFASASGWLGRKIFFDCGREGLLAFDTDHARQLYGKFFKITLEEIPESEILQAEREGKR